MTSETLTSERFELRDGTLVEESQIVLSRHYKAGQEVVLASRHYDVVSSDAVGSVKRVVVKEA